jgi:hypothetical protein
MGQGDLATGDQAVLSEKLTALPLVFRNSLLHAREGITREPNKRMLTRVSHLSGGTNPAQARVAAAACLIKRFIQAQL